MTKSSPSDDEWTAEDVLRDLACYVSAGGHNAPTVDPAEFRRKIRDGIDHEVDFWRKRAEVAELRLKLGLEAGNTHEAP
jgi:hypothetical protein